MARRLNWDYNDVVHVNVVMPIVDCEMPDDIGMSETETITTV
jgi:hypothetical protein